MQPTVHLEHMGIYDVFASQYYEAALKAETVFEFERQSRAEWFEVLRGFGNHGLFKLVWGYRRDGDYALLTPNPEDHKTTVFLYRTDLGHWNVKLATTETRFGDLCKALEDLIPPAEPLRGKVPVKFWSLSQNGPVERTRDISAHEWSEIKVNYPATVRQAMDQLTQAARPEGCGRLVLMHGVPGTGKTYGIAALGLAWKSWARFSYIVDPDEFLGKAEYMMSVLMDGDPDLWRVIVMEDVDEFLTMDAKERSGQALGRLLNLTEGFVGNGLKVLVLMTTNESMKDVHPAVARPGRCLQEIEFTEMSVAESAAWIRRVPHLGSNPQTLIREAYTLAELYSIVAGRPVRPRKETVGIR